MKEILGTWKLLSFYNLDDFGKKNHIMGEKPIGSINYTNTHMSALLAYEGYSQGRSLKRNYKIEDNKLTIWAEEKLNGVWQSVTLEWIKA
jgi:hypothetical protein